MRRRRFLGLAGASSLAGPARGVAQAADAGASFYASTGSRVSGYAATQDGRLRRVTEPYEAMEQVQSCWRCACSGVWYVASSDQNTRGQGRHFVEAVRVGPDGALARLGEPVALDSRPIDITADIAGRYILVAHNRPPTVSVFETAATGAVGARIPQPASLDAGIYPHQIRLFPDQRSVLIPARGNDATSAGPEDPGSLQVLAFRSGVLRNVQRVAPGQGLNYRPRHAAFHPSGRWLYVDLESQNQVQAHEILGDGRLSEPLFTASTLAQPARVGQIASAVVMHPSGRTLYVANRGAGTEPFGGAQVSVGEDSVAVFSLDALSGRPTRVQSAPIPGVHPRTLALSPDGDWLVAATILPAAVRVGDHVQPRPAGLSLFRVGADGRLTYRSKLDVDTAEGPVFWVGSAA